MESFLGAGTGAGGTRLTSLGFNVINLLHIPGEQQVMLKVTVAEVNHAATRSIGINFSVVNDHGIQVFQNTTGSVAPNLTAMLDNGRIPVLINALRTLSLARSLAEPNLVTLNGQTANFQAGGEFPVPRGHGLHGGRASGGILRPLRGPAQLYTAYHGPQPDSFERERQYQHPGQC